MFGDMAHGFFLFLFGLYLAIKEDYYNKRLKQMDEVRPEKSLLRLNLKLTQSIDNPHSSWSKSELFLITDHGYAVPWAVHYSDDGDLCFLRGLPLQ